LERKTIVLAIPAELTKKIQRKEKTMLKYSLLAIAMLALTTTPVLASDGMKFILDVFPVFMMFMNWIMCSFGACSLLFLFFVTEDFASSHSFPLMFNNIHRFLGTLGAGIPVLFLLFERFVFKIYPSPSWDYAFAFNFSVFCVLAIVSILVGLYSLIPDN
jgi:hypothetical protein